MKLIRFGGILFILLLTLTLSACAGNGTDEGPTEGAPGVNNGTEPTDEGAPDTGTETPEGTEEGPAETSLASQGEEVYQKTCISCHGANLEGGAGPALNNITLSKEEIVEVIKNGRGQMPGNLAPGQEEAIAEYLLSQQ
jgi:mono/diheme cytochrome c family protein